MHISLWNIRFTRDILFRAHSIISKLLYLMIPEYSAYGFQRNCRHCFIIRPPSLCGASCVNQHELRDNIVFSAISYGRIPCIRVILLPCTTQICPCVRLPHAHSPNDFVQLFNLCNTRNFSGMHLV